MKTKLSVLGKNTWNYTTMSKLFVLDRNTWYHITVFKDSYKIKCKYKYTTKLIIDIYAWNNFKQVVMQSKSFNQIDQINLLLCGL